MKCTNDKEMDLLLSRLARREAVGASVLRANEGDDEGRARDAAVGVHLDADELNAYAENALQPATRSRYSVHLADCETCRKSVTRLALAGGVVGQLERSAASGDASDDRSWWQRIAALFALPVVRYGVPALLLFAVIMVAFLATRQQQSASLVALNEKQKPSPVSAVEPDQETEENHSQANRAETTTATTQYESGDSAPSTNGSTSPPPAKAPQEIEQNGAVAGGGPNKEVAQGNANSNAATLAPPLAGPNATLSKPVDEPEQKKREDARQLPGPDNASAANTSSTIANRAVQESQKSTDTLTDKREATGGLIARAQPTPAPPPRREPPADVAVNGTKDEETDALKNKPRMMAKAAPSAPLARGRGAAGRAATESSADRRSAPASESAGEKRSVAGRTFRRQGSAWVDTAYTPPRATVNVARGSEQYRALVADEPSIRTIAEQLGGEVILIWKGRAYRIH